MIKLKDLFNEIAVRPKPKKFRDIYDALPSDLKKRVMNLKNFDQRRDAHPEGNVLKHTIAVTNRALKTGDIDFALSALFHDIGKDSTAALHPKKGFWTHYGHEKVSAVLVKKYATWIKSMGGDVDDIHYIVKQHMRMKVFDKMRWHKQDKMRKDKGFGKLQKFTTFDKGGRGIREASEVKKTIAVYGGRFQPFHSGHMATYKWLKSKFNEVYITTSNIKQPPRHPLNFKEKVKHMVKMGIPKNRIVNEKSPYVAVNLLKKFDSDKAAKLVPDMTSLNNIFSWDEKTIKEKVKSDQLSNAKKLISLSEGSDLTAETINLARKLEGNVRNTGTHACGVIITPEPLMGLIPVTRAKDSDLMVTQFDNSVVEEAELRKMDFLGLTNLTIIKDCQKIIKKFV